MGSVTPKTAELEDGVRKFFKKISQGWGTENFKHLKHDTIVSILFRNKFISVSMYNTLEVHLESLR